MSKIVNPLSLFIENSKGVFFLIIAICGNYMAETLNCQLQKELTQNRVFKYLVVFFTIYMSITLITKKPVNPFKPLLNSIIIFIIFIFFTRMTIYPTYISITIFILINFINNYLLYLNVSRPKITSQKNILNIILKLLLITLFIVMVIGNIQYFQEKRKQFGSKLKFINYLFGNYQCNTKVDLKRN